MYLIAIIMLSAKYIADIPVVSLKKKPHDFVTTTTVITATTQIAVIC